MTIDKAVDVDVEGLLGRSAIGGGAGNRAAWEKPEDTTCWLDRNVPIPGWDGTKAAMVKVPIVVLRIPLISHSENDQASWSPHFSVSIKHRASRKYCAIISLL